MKLAMNAQQVRRAEPAMCAVIDRAIEAGFTTRQIIQILRRNSTNPYSDHELALVIEALR